MNFQTSACPLYNDSQLEKLFPGYWYDWFFSFVSITFFIDRLCEYIKRMFKKKLCSLQLVRVYQESFVFFWWVVESLKNKINFDMFLFELWFILQAGKSLSQESFVFFDGLLSWHWQMKLIFDMFLFELWFVLQSG